MTPAKRMAAWSPVIVLVFTALSMLAMALDAVMTLRAISAAISPPMAASRPGPAAVFVASATRSGRAWGAATTFDATRASMSAIALAALTDLLLTSDTISPAMALSSALGPIPS